MAEYIDRKTTIEAVHSAMYPYFCGAEDGDILSDDEKLVLSVNKRICTAIIALPSADVVEVVRCKYCVYSNKSFNGLLCAKVPNRFLYVYDDDYCSYGERKDG